MAAIRLLAVVGRPGAGATTLAQALAGEYRRRGCRVTVLDAAAHPAGADPTALVRTGIGAGTLDADVVIADGFLRPMLPRIEVYRRVTGPAPLHTRGAPDVEDCIALLSDDRAIDTPCRTFHFHDTMWLQLLANLAWDRAKVVPT